MCLALFDLVLAQAAGDASQTGNSIVLGLGVLFGVVGGVVWIWAIVDAVRNPSLGRTARVLWLLGIVITGIVGAILYVLYGRAPKAPIETT